MTEGFISTTLVETRREAADKMLDGDFSQLPIREMEEGQVVGIVTDTDLMGVHNDEKPIEEIEFHHVIEVARDTDRHLIEKILEEGHPAVLVADGETPEGIITRADLLETTSPIA
jgi:predicted transcriptional regulator